MPTLDAMPSKREPGKRGRYAENRARREALAARSANASRPVERSSDSAKSTSANSATKSGAKAGGRSRVANRRADTWFGRLSGQDGAVGARAVFFALLFSVFSAIATLFIPVQVDDSGERLTQEEVEELEDAGETVDEEALYTTLDPTIGLLLAVPVVASGFAARGVRQSNRRRVVMVSMVVSALGVLGTGPLFVPVVLALGVAHFQIRKAELQEAAAAAAGDDDRDVIDVDEVDDAADDEPFDEVDDIDENREPDEVDDADAQRKD